MPLDTTHTGRATPRPEHWCSSCSQWRRCASPEACQWVEPDDDRAPLEMLAYVLTLAAAAGAAALIIF